MSGFMGFREFGSRESKWSGNYNSHQIDALAKSEKIRIAITYDRLFENDVVGGIPAKWIRVGEWKISNNIVCGDDTISFYAVDPSETDLLIENLKTFSSFLPKDIVQTGEYTIKSG